MIQFLVSLLATLSFAVLFSAPRRELLFCGLTGAIGWMVYIISLDLHTNAAIANLIATLTLTLVARTLSAIRRNPVTIYLLTGIFPLLFVPAAAGVMDLWADLQAMLVPVLLALIPITILVMTVSGCVTQRLAERKEKKQ